MNIIIKLKFLLMIIFLVNLLRLYYVIGIYLYKFIIQRKTCKIKRYYWLHSKPKKKKKIKLFYRTENLLVLLFPFVIIAYIKMTF